MRKVFLNVKLLLKDLIAEIINRGVGGGISCDRYLDIYAKVYNPRDASDHIPSPVFRIYIYVHLFHQV